MLPSGEPSTTPLAGRRSGSTLAAVVLATLVFSAAPARAGLIITAQSVTVASGSTGDTFEVTLTNTGPSAAAAIGGFTFEVMASSNNFMFTSVSNATTTAPYIFDGLGLFGPSLLGPGGIGTNPPTLNASDLFSVIGSGTTLAAGATVGLGQVKFDIASGTPSGMVNLTFVPVGTSLSDTAFPTPGAFKIDTLTGGTVTVTNGPAVPEPSTPVLACVALLAAAGRACWTRRRKSTA